MNHNPHKAHGCGCACGSVHPVDVLSEEHRTIVAVLDAADRELRHLDEGDTPRRVFWVGFLDFLEHYADRCHHGKEEDLLFAELEQAGMPREHGPTHCMRSEHDTMRAGRRRMADAVAADDGATLAHAAHGYVDMLRDHIDKEDQVLFPMAKSMLDGAAVERLRRGFQRVEQDVMGEGTHCRYEELARALCADHDTPAAH